MGADRCRWCGGPAAPALDRECRPCHNEKVLDEIERRARLAFLPPPRVVRPTAGASRLHQAAEDGVRRVLLGRRLPDEEFRAVVAAVEARLAAVPGLAGDGSLWRKARALAVRVLQEREAQYDGR